MKNKNFDFKNIKGMLSRDEMKQIKGGSGSGSNCIKDGQACGWFEVCCHSCNASFMCAATQ